MTNVAYPNTYWVVPGQFLAGEHPVEYGDAATIARLSLLLASGVRTFVELTEAHEMKSYAPLVANLAREHQLDVTHLRTPIQDRKVPAQSTLIKILDAIDHSIRDGKPVFAHCFAGIGRTGTVVGCYLQRHGLADASGVISRIAQLRSAMPSGREPSPHTAEQVEFVENWRKGQ